MQVAVLVSEELAPGPCSLPVCPSSPLHLLPRSLSAHHWLCLDVLGTTNSAFPVGLVAVFVLSYCTLLRHPASSTNGLSRLRCPLAPKSCYPASSRRLPGPIALLHGSAPPLFQPPRSQPCSLVTAFARAVPAGAVPAAGNTIYSPLPPRSLPRLSQQMCAPFPAVCACAS